MERMRCKIIDLKENSTFKLKNFAENVKLCNVNLREYQHHGIKWLIEQYENKIGSCLCDEMGLGKTCQTIGLLSYVAAKSKGKKFLIVCPLSVVNNWSQELERFAPQLSTLVYIGDKETRTKLARGFARKKIILTTYELIIKDMDVFKDCVYEVMVVDEGHRLKNSNSQLYMHLDTLVTGMRLLLTGTPIQNNLDELYSLLSFVQSNVFKFKYKDKFVNEYATKLHALSDLLDVFVLRRMKNQVNIEIPEKREVVLYHGLTELQKKTYKAVLQKDTNAFNGNEKVKLMNILMCLRKICAHPYLMPNIEPEPFEAGEHLIESSGKFKLLDSLLHHLHKNGHKVLIFSQFTTVLDIVQDYLTYREYNYERLDGSIRSEERNLAIKNFSADESFVFLLSTKAGGVGLNLVSADTCIFMDNDFNPQNDLQAAARCHRIGQTRPVLIVRMIAKSTVEQIIYKRALAKFKLSTEVMDQGVSDIDRVQLSDILKYGLDELFGEDSDKSDEKIDFVELLGDSINGEWVFSVSKLTAPNDDTSGINTIYEFEGEDYASERDKNKFNSLLNEVDSEHTMKLGLKRKKPIVDQEEAKQRKIEADESRKKRLQELREQAQERLKQEWNDNNYKSFKIECANIDNDDEDSSDDNDETKSINFENGDVTHPKYSPNTNAIIIHCVDNSGVWGKGGLFDALVKRSNVPRVQYELALKMKDLKFKDVHLIELGNRENGTKDYLAFIVAHKRDKNGALSPLNMQALDDCFKKVYLKAKELGASIHMPRIGHKTPNFNWYGVEKLIKKHFSNKNVETYIYYFKKDKRNHDLPSIFTGMNFYFPQKCSNLLEYDQIERYIIAYDGNIELKNVQDPSQITHIILKNDIELDDEYKNAVKVDVSWVEQSIIKKKIVDIENFTF